MVPRKHNVAHRRPVAVDTQKAEGQGNLGDPGTSPLDQEVDKSQWHGGQQGQHRLVFWAVDTEHMNI